MITLRLFAALAFTTASLQASDSAPALASASHELAAGLVNLYFSAPLIHQQMSDSSSWERHVGLGARDAEQLLPTIWESYCKNQKKASQQAYKNREIIIGDDHMPFTISRNGTVRNDKKQPLTISLHGGGDMPKAKNDAQWKAQQTRYPDAPGIYVCPRAPRDTWNQWHADHIAPLIEELVRVLLVHENVDPNQIYLMGYSAGGYGAFQLGNASPDRFAAIAASAAAPTANQTPAEHWKHLPLRFEIGEKDNAYNRVNACRNYAQALDCLQRQNDGSFAYTFIEHENQGHQIADQACVKWLEEHTRTHRPKSLTWKPTSPLVHQFYWLANDEPMPGQEVAAQIEGNRISLKTKDVQHLKIRLDDQLVNLDHPVTIVANGMKIFEGDVARELRCLVQTLEERGDPKLAFCSEISLYIP